jgi:hypothetical protein
MNDAAYFDDFLDDATESHDAQAPTCRHWQHGAACRETCACGHGCADHHDAGWCARCGCPAWTDAPAADVRPLRAVATTADDGWELADLLDEDDYDEAAGW